MSSEHITAAAKALVKAEQKLKRVADKAEAYVAKETAKAEKAVADKLAAAAKKTEEFVAKKTAKAAEVVADKVKAAEAELKDAKDAVAKAAGTI
jgi:hypothetical protein